MNGKQQRVSVQDAWRLPHVTTFPRYDRSRLGCGIAHIGVGNFHRAHQALFLHDYLQAHPEHWMVHGIGALEADIPLMEAMRSQANLYSLTERSGSGDTLKVIGSIKAFSHAPADPQRVIQLLAADEIKIISLTITEKGYCYDAAGNLDNDHPLIQADLRKDAIPRSALGYLFSAARQRMAHNGSPVTIMSCDNLPGNGNMTRRLLLQFADEKQEPAVADWIRHNTSFPNSMVDRITPAVTAETLAFVRDTWGIVDACPVVSEAFIQWIVEDHFINGRPRLETVGVQFTGNVEPYEMLKMRMLNGSHSALAYVAYLMGFRHVDEAMNDRIVRAFVQRYMDDDITPTIPDVPGVDVTAYKATLLERFANPAVRDQVQRLAMDGSQKLRNFMVPPLEHQLASSGSIRWLTFALAAWYRYLRGIDEHGAAIEIVDPMRDSLMERVRSSPHNPRPLLSELDVLGEQVSADNRVAAAVKEHLDAIDKVGTRAALSRLLEQ